MLATLSKRERAGLRELLAVSYFNQKAILRQLYTTLETQLPTGHPHLDRPAIWERLLPKQTYDDAKLRQWMTQLTRLVEQFLAFSQVTQDTVTTKEQAAKRLVAAEQHELAERLAKEAQAKRRKHPQRNADYWLATYRYASDRFQQQLSEQPGAVESYTATHQQLELVFLALKFRQRTWLTNHSLLFNRDLPNSKLDQFLDTLTEVDLPDAPAVRVYYYGYQLLRAADPAAAFERFKAVLFAHSQVFPKAEALDLYLLAINFGIRQINAGYRHFFPAVMDLYKDALDRGYLLSKGELSRFTYHNMVTIALQTQEVNWAEDFIDTWTSKLERRYRERMQNFSRARIAYARQDYGAALPLLQQANYHDSLLNLGARTLLLKIYYELGELDVLQSHLDAFQSYIRRKADLTYHRANYRNLIGFTRKLLKLPPNGQKKREHLREQIIRAKVLTEKEWLLSQLN
ncbi:MAG: hypothetical protein AAGJ82_04850 [Bacteroidota bacterium]